MCGQSSRKTRSSNRRFVRKILTLEGPDGVYAGGAEGTGFKLLLGATRRLLERPREGLIVADDILRQERYYVRIITWYSS